MSAQPHSKKNIDDGALAIVALIPGGNGFIPGIWNPVRTMESATELNERYRYAKRNGELFPVRIPERETPLFLNPEHVVAINPLV